MDAHGDTWPSSDVATCASIAFSACICPRRVAILSLSLSARASVAAPS